MAMINKLKDSEQKKITSSQSDFLVQYCRKWTSRKFHRIIMDILHKNNLQLIN